MLICLRRYIQMLCLSILKAGFYQAECKKTHVCAFCGALGDAHFGVLTGAAAAAIYKLLSMQKDSLSTG